MTAVAACAGALGAGLTLLARARTALLSGLALLGAAAIVLAIAFVEQLGGPDRLPVPTSPAALAAAAAGTLAIVGLTAVLVRFPAAVVPLLLLAAPLRPPLDPDPEAPLLVALRPDALVGYHLPLYAVLTAGALALAWRALRGAPIHPLPRRLAYPAAALIGLVALSLLWSRDEDAGLNQVLLFWLPAAALVAVVAHAPFRPWTPRALAYVAVALGCVLAAVGIGQVVAGEIFFATPALAQANATTELFRVTSLFQDPSIYGRELVVTMAVVLVALWAARLRMAVGVALLALLAVALYFTYSQSSLIALALVALAIPLAAGDRRTRLAVLAPLAVVAVAGTVAITIALASGSAAELTRNRSELVGNTALVFANHPLAGVGVGAEPVATRQEAETGTTLGRSTSHTTPLTVAAELGLPGLVAYLALLGGAVMLLRDLHRRDPALAIGLAAVLWVLFVHSLVYEGFFETAVSWGAMALAAAALRDERTRGLPDGGPHDRQRAAGVT